jgi:SAM-dependent MidA family methyltransferase
MPGPNSHTNLPLPDAVQQAHSRRVVGAVSAALAAGGGWLPFDEYLRIVMYAPGLGYYSAGAAKFGAAGDFVTAPELSSLFGYCVARQCSAVLIALAAAGARTTVLELGGGSGKLAADVLTRLDSLDSLPAEYLLLEVSADLHARQQACIGALRPTLASRVRWIDSLPATPLHGVILANEVADALPFKCFIAGAEGFEELGVVIDEPAGLRWQARRPTPALQQELARLQTTVGGPGIARGHRSECCLLLDGWIASLGAALATGAILLFDYGVGRRDYYHADRHRGSLRCHYRHRAHDDPFLLPGLQDITAWVDFTRAAEAADAAGLQVAGYCTQAAFLLGAGIDAELQINAAAAAGDANAPGQAAVGVAAARRAAEARQLLLPGEMGENFKALALTRALPASLQAFELQDLRRTL